MGLGKARNFAKWSRPIQWSSRQGKKSLTSGSRMCKCRCQHPVCLCSTWFQNVKWVKLTNSDHIYTEWDEPQMILGTGGCVSGEQIKKRSQHNSDMFSLKTLVVCVCVCVSDKIECIKNQRSLNQIKCRKFGLILFFGKFNWKELLINYIGKQNRK